MIFGYDRSARHSTAFVLLFLWCGGVQPKDKARCLLCKSCYSDRSYTSSKESKLTITSSHTLYTSRHDVEWILCANAPQLIEKHSAARRDSKCVVSDFVRAPRSFWLIVLWHRGGAVPFAAREESVFSFSLSFSLSLPPLRAAFGFDL